MDLHFVTLALGEANFSCFNRRIISSGEPANVRFGNYSDDASLPLDCWVSATIGDMVPSGAVMPVHLGASKYDRQAGRTRWPA
jgi:hypothetical protein